tara:strand:- start:1136 stop:1672 length:537 start_codon:yes stop_codon:yes gene_type:complete
LPVRKSDGSYSIRTPYARKEELLQIIQEVLGPDHPTPNLRIETLPGREGQEFTGKKPKPLGGFHRGTGDIYIDPDIIDENDMRYVAAHEAAHAKHLKKAGVERFKRTPIHKREYIADDMAMRYHKSKGGKLGALMKFFTEQEGPRAKRFAKQAGKFGLLPLLVLSLLPMLMSNSKQEK